MWSARIWSVIYLLVMKSNYSGIWNFSRRDQICRSKQFVRHTEQYHTTVILAVLLISFPFQGRNNQPPFSVGRNGARLPFIIQHCLQPMDHGFILGSPRLCTYFNCLSTYEEGSHWMLCKLLKWCNLAMLAICMFTREVMLVSYVVYVYLL